ncbi:MAG: hypothetical protein JXM79_12465 [Sedimentisphaerales bacterium]|nr:hypothetical protein [Sedimentisphaerales bacterium]
MDSAKLILTESVSPPDPLGQLDTSSLNGASEKEKEKIAKDFESVLLNKLLGEMQNSIGEWGFEKSSSIKQVEGIFCMFLARDVASNGGIGLWKDIYSFLTNTNQANTSANPLDTEI